MTDVTVPEPYADLLERPLFAHLATVRPDGAPQSSVMWFRWHDGRLQFTHTKNRQKYRNLAHEPRVAVSIADDADPYRYLEVRGVVEGIADDPGGAFYRVLQERYSSSGPISHVDLRVVVTVRPTAFVAVRGGSVEGAKVA